MGEEQTQWGWHEPHEEIAHGPFPTRGDAVRDAREHGASEVNVGLVHYPDPAEAVTYAADMDWVLERMDEWACDNWLRVVDGEIFDPGPGARDTLKQALAEWARKHVASDCWTLVQTERVQVPEVDDG